MRRAAMARPNPPSARRQVTVGLDDYDLGDLGVLQGAWKETAAGAIRRALNEYAQLVRDGNVPPRKKAA